MHHRYSGRDAEINRVLNVLSALGNVMRPPLESTARLAGTLRYAARTDDGIDALVAAEAAQDKRTAVVLTSDPADLARLLVNEKQVAIRRV